MASGYYIDVGGSRLVMDGKIGIRSGAGVDRLEKHAVVLSDGSTLEADAVVYATGFGSMEERVARLIDRSTADRFGRCWGCGSGHRGDPGPWEGEIRNIVEANGAAKPVVHGRQSGPGAYVFALSESATTIQIP